MMTKREVMSLRSFCEEQVPWNFGNNYQFHFDIPLHGTIVPLAGTIIPPCGMIIPLCGITNTKEYI
jgi:hypothetical protein